ncbi:MAG: hydrogenase iron-sulfur subunit, partial [Candidatus Ranarchaeia archaeon]
YLCSTTGTQEIEASIKEHGIDRIVIAACTPKLHGQLFRKVLDNAGLNPYLIEFANIREQCSWVHSDNPSKATEKAIDLIKMAIAAVKHHMPQTPIKVQVKRHAIVLGGGIAGITAALRLADTGFPVTLIEKSPTIGGHMAMLDKTFPSLDCSICILAPLMSEVERHPLITLYTNSELVELQGSAGNFHAKIRHFPRCIDEDKCRGCVSTCIEPCPIEVPSEWDQNMKPRKAIYVPFVQASPLIPLIDWEHCIGCRNCEISCGHDAISFDQQPSEESINTGAVIVATGFSLFDAALKPEYGYNLSPNVLTAIELERLLNPSGPTNGRVVRITDGAIPRRVAFILCVGSRDESAGAPFCSRICCMAAVKQALEIKEQIPNCKITIFYQDIRAFGKGYEEMYLRALSKGIQFIRGRPARIIAASDGEELYVRTEDTLAQQPIEVPTDLVVLMTGVRPQKGNEKLAEILRVDRSPSGFLKERHPKLRVAESSRPGIYLAGTSQGPKDIQDTVTHAGEAAAKVLGFLSQDVIELDPYRAEIDQEKCTRCQLCIAVCPFDAIKITPDTREIKIHPTACTGCGACAGACPSGAIDFPLYSDDAIHAMIDAATHDKKDQPLIVAFLCNWCGYDGVDFAGVSRLQYPPNIRSIRILCTARMNPDFIIRALRRGADGVLVAGCHPQDCHYKYGFQKAKQRVDYVKNAFASLGLDNRRIKLISIAGSEGEKFAKEVHDFVQILSGIGPIADDIKTGKNKVVSPAVANRKE